MGHYTASMETTQQSAFAELIGQHRRIIFKVANTYGFHAQDRDDLAQEITAQLWRAFPGYDMQRTLPGNTDDPVSLHWQMVAAMAEFMEAVSDAMTRGVSRNSMRRCDNRAADLQAHVNNLLGALRAQLPHQQKESGQ